MASATIALATIGVSRIAVRVWSVEQCGMWDELAWVRAYELYIAVTPSLDNERRQMVGESERARLFQLYRPIRDDGCRVERRELSLVREKVRTKLCRMVAEVDLIHAANASPVHGSLA